MPYETILYSVADRIATITVNRPDKLNALNDRVIAELADAIDSARANADVGGVILTGAGRAFVGGRHLRARESRGGLGQGARAARARCLSAL